MELSLAIGTGGHIGANLWAREGRVATGWDLVAELGGVVSWGQSDDYSVAARNGNFALGGRTSVWLRAGSNRVRFESLLSAGWMRGQKVWAEDRKLGGFHGIIISLGIGLTW